VRSIRPIIEYKRFQPMKIFRPVSQKDAGSGKQTLGFRLQGSYITGFGGLAAPPFQRFFMGGDTDLRGFDTRTVTPYTFITTTTNVTLTNPDGSAVPVDPSNPLRGNVSIPLVVQQLIYTGGDASMVANVEYRIPLAGPVALAIFNDLGFDAVVRSSQLQLSQTQINTLNTGRYFCPAYTPGTGCTSMTLPYTVNSKLQVISGTNWQPRDSLGVELQIMMPVVNAPFRLYYAYNPLRVDRTFSTPGTITRSMFPATDAGEYTYRQVINAYSPSYLLREPRKTFRFTVSTTF